MARARLIKKNDRCYIELPKEFLNNDEVELFSLKEGYYLITVPLGKELERTASDKPSTKLETGNSKPTSEEIAVLYKLQSIKFSERTSANVAKQLNEKEKETLSALEKKGLINLFKGKKYPNGVYNINDAVYPLLKNTKLESKTESTKASVPSASAPVCRDSLCALLMKQGYLVIRDTQEAKDLSEKLKAEMKSGLVIGIKGFDGVFYVVTKSYLSDVSKIILDTLKEAADVKTITQNTKLETDAVSAVLHHLAESGDVIEKKRGVYVVV